MRMNETPRGSGKFARAHQWKRRWLAAVTCMAALVVFCTVYALVMPATALEKKTYCGMEEHTHDDSCYESVLICGQEEGSGHVHDESCYEQELTCGKTEHTHTDECYVEPVSENSEAGADAEVAAMPDGAQVPDGYTQQYTARDDENGFAVTVYAPEGAVPDGAKLSAELLTEDDDAYLTAEEALAENNSGTSTQSKDSESAESDYGFAAMDIHFEDANGNEVEPDGDVYVVIDAAGLLPEGADTESITVQHHVEKDNGDVTVETVADTADETDGVVVAQADEDSENSGVQAAFEVKSFSTFTIRWKGNDRQTLTARAVAISNNRVSDIGNSDGHVTLNIIEETPVEALAQSVTDYTFSYAVVANSSANANTLRRGERVVAVRRNSNNWQYMDVDGNWNTIDSDESLYFVYIQDMSDSSDSITFIYYNSDGNNNNNEINDNHSIAARNAVKYTIALLDADGNETYDLPSGSTFPDVFTFDSDTVAMNAASFEEMGIYIPGYTYDDSYAYFYWYGNFDGPKNTVAQFHNFGALSTNYRNSSNYYDSYIGFTRTDATGSDYAYGEFGSEGTGYFAYNPTGTLRIVLREATYDQAFQAHFVDAYLQQSTSVEYDATDMKMDLDDSNQYYGMLQTVTDEIPEREGYVFNGWYDSVDSDGNGMGTRIQYSSDDTTHYYADKTYYARWTPIGGSGGDTEEEPVTPEHNKYIKDNGNGTYDLSLNVSGEVEITTEKIPINILYILDTSYSMIWDMDGGHASGDDGDEDTYKNSFDRMEAAQDAIDALNADNALGDTSKFDTRYAMVTFDKQVNNIINWTADSGDLFKAECVGGTDDFHSGTNYANALTAANNLIGSAPDEGNRSNAQTIVVFLTDGQPNWPRPVDDDGDSHQDLQYSQDQAVLAARTINCDQFYAIGVGENGEGEEYRSNLEEVVAAVTANTKTTYVATESNELVDYFKNMIANFTSVDCTNVVITDTLSKYAELTDNSTFRISITDANNEPIAVSNSQISIEDASNQNGTNVTFTSGSNESITLNVKYTESTNIEDNNGTFILTFPENYALENGWTYTITVTVQPTDIAYDDYNLNQYAGNTGDPNTDATGNTTSSGQPGFDSNKEATLTYDSAGKEQEKEYPDPVIQVKFESVTFQKVDMTDATTPLSGADFLLYYKVEEKEGDNVTTTNYYYKKDGNAVNWVTDSADATPFTSGQDGLFTIEGLRLNKNYYLKESVAPNGYNLSDDEIQIEWRNGSAYPTIAGELLKFEEVSEGQGIVIYHITNSKGVELPETGGPGTTFVTIGGLLLMAAAVGGGYGLRRRRGREGR